MGLKVDSSFLKFLTMGALGTRRVFDLMSEAGLQPIELERYSRSNKIWSTKVKRLRLPDLLCVRTGLRVEVKGKSKLTIKMSDSPNNADRQWDAGLADRDMIAFVHIQEGDDGRMGAADNAELFWVEDLRTTVAQSKLGPPKSAGEGAERDREWPSTVAKRNGEVTTADEDRFTVALEGGRRQTYRLNGKSLYVGAGERFVADSQFLAGIPRTKASFPTPEETHWNPRPLLTSASSIDRYVAVKALGVIGETSDVPAIANVAENDTDERVKLEASVALVCLKDVRGVEMLRTAIDDPVVDYLRMEALLALAEFRGHSLAPQCASLLAKTARNEALCENEARQAAIWGLGKDGLCAYRELLGLLDATDDNELIHAVSAFGSDADVALVDELIAVVVSATSSVRLRSSASSILARTIPPVCGVPRLEASYHTSPDEAKNWILATLGQMDPTAVMPLITSSNLAALLIPFYLTSPETNWTRSVRLMDSLAFVRKQTIATSQSR